MATNILDNIDPQKLGELLQQARGKCGMTQADAAKVIDVARTTMVAIEKGERRLRASELIDLARAYGRSVSDFVSSRPVIQPFSVQFRAPYHRDEDDEEQIGPVVTRLHDLCTDYLELEEIVNFPLAKNYPSDEEYKVSNIPTEKAAEMIAISERQRLGFDDRPIPILRDILEQSVGLRIFYLEMPPKYSEVYGYNEQVGGCMAVNSNHPEERRRWSMAHGYLHFLVHRYKPTIDVVNLNTRYKRIPESEKLAEAFAKYFLMPTNSLLREFNEIDRIQGKFTPTNLFALANRYGVSLEALSYRLEEMELLRSGTWTRLRDRGLKVRSVQKELGLGEIPQRSDRFPLHYQHLAIDALDRGLITEGGFANFLNVDRLEARRISAVLRDRESEILEEVVDMDLRKV